MRRQPDPAAIDSWYALGYVFGRRVVPYLLLAAFWTLSWLLIASCAAEAAQEASIPRAVDDCPAWTDHPIVTGVTPLRAEHINEIRACIDFLLQRDPLPVQPPCEDAWTHSGTGPAIIDVPACLDQVRLRVSPSTSTVSRFWFWKRDTL